MNSVLKKPARRMLYRDVHGTGLATASGIHLENRDSVLAYRHIMAGRALGALVDSAAAYSIVFPERQETRRSCVQIDGECLLPDTTL